MEPIWSVILYIHGHSHAPLQTSHRYSGPGSVKSRTTSTRCSKSETRDEQNPKTFHGDQVNDLWNLFYFWYRLQIASPRSPTKLKVKCCTPWGGSWTKTISKNHFWLLTLVPYVGLSMECMSTLWLSWLPPHQKRKHTAQISPWFGGASETRRKLQGWYLVWGPYEVPASETRRKPVGNILKYFVGYLSHLCFMNPSRAGTMPTDQASRHYHFVNGMLWILH